MNGTEEGGATSAGAPGGTRESLIDCQLHELGPRSLAAVPDMEHRRRILLEVTVSAMDAVGLYGAVLHAHDEEFGALAVREFPERFGRVVNLTGTSEMAREQVVKAGADPSVLGVRIVAGVRSDGAGSDRRERLESGVYDEALGCAESLRLPVFLFVTGDLWLADRLAQRYPEVPFIIDHLGLRQPPADERDEPPLARLPDVLALAEHHNVFVKLCGLPALSASPYPYRDVWQGVRQFVDAFGAERLLWGSDASRFQRRTTWSWNERTYRFPQVGGHSYAEALLFLLHSDCLAEAEKSLVLGENARRVLQWPARGR
jgi:L-fuconolactonase